MERSQDKQDENPESLNPVQDNGRPGYKHTPLGWIPEEWDYYRINDVAEKSKGAIKIGPFGSQLKKEDFIQEGIKVYDQETAFSNDFYRGYNYISKEKYESLKSCTINPGDIIVSMMGTIGAAAIVPKFAPLGILNSHLLRIKPNSEIITDEYLRLSFSESPITRLELKKKSHGGIMSGLSAEIVKSIVIAIPPLPEQRRIAAILSTWDEAITKTQQLIAQLQQRNKGLMQQLLKPKGDWKEYRIGNLLKEVKRSVKWNEEELYHLISVRRRSGGAFFRESLYGKQILTKQLFTAEAGDFLFSKMQIVHGASAIVPKELDGMKISGSYIAVQTNEEKIMDINFFNWLSKTRWFYRLTYVSSYGVHIEKMTFDFNDFKRRKIMIPPTVKEQKRIVNILETANGEVHLHEQQLSILQQQKKGLMQKLLTGEVRVKIDNN